MAISLGGASRWGLKAAVASLILFSVACSASHKPDPLSVPAIQHSAPEANSAGGPGTEDAIVDSPSELLNVLHGTSDYDYGYYVQFKYGADFASELPHSHVSTSADKARFYASGDDYAYCCYAINLRYYVGREYQLHLDWQQNIEPGKVWIGLANFISDRWDWFQYDPQVPLDIPEKTLYLSATRQVLACVVVLGDSHIELDWMRVGENLTPLASLETPSRTYGNYEIDIDFDASASIDYDGEITAYEWDLDGDGVVDETTALPYLTHTYAAVDQDIDVTPALTVVDDQGSTASAELGKSVVVRFNLGPKAILWSSHLCAIPPIEVTYDASQSYDPDGEIVEYAWDIHADGSIDFTTAEPSMTYTFESTAENGKVYLRVTDDDGAKDGESALIQLLEPPVAGEWQHLDMRGDLFPCSLGIVDGKPGFLLAYRGADKVQYAHALDGNSTVWNSFETPPLSPYSNYSRYNLVDIGGLPAFAYVDNQTHDIVFSRATDADWREASDSTLISESSYCSRVVCVPSISGNPALIYMDIGLPDGLSANYYAAATNPNGSAWNEPVVIAPPAEDTPYGYDLAEVAGQPALCLLDERLLYCRANNAQGDSWPEPIVIDAPPGQRCYDATLLITDGLPTIVYRRRASKEDNTLLIVRALDITGGAWAAPTETGVSGYVYSPRADLLEGRLAVAYVNVVGYDHRLMYIEAQNDAGTSWSEPETVATDTYFGFGCLSFTASTGQPMIGATYGDYSDGGEAAVYIRH